MADANEGWSRLSWALYWGSQAGFRIFPLLDNRKEARFKGWLEEATTDARQIQEWWARWPQANIGVLCTDMIVVDVDAHHNGFASLASLNLPPTLSVSTPRGGKHLYYRGPSRANSVGEIAPGIDIRSYHGYVVGPGSYLDDGRAKGFYTLDQNIAMADAPAHLVNRLALPRERVTQTDFTLENTDQPVAVKLATDFLRGAHDAAAGEQNNTLYVLAAQCKNFGVSPTTAKALFESIYLPRQSPPIAIDIAAKIIDNAYEYSLEPLGSQNPAAHYQGLLRVESPAEIQAGFAPQPVSFRGIIRVGGLVPRTFGEVPEIPFVVPNFLMRGTVSVLSAPGGVGKSTFFLTAAAHFASARSWLGFGPERPLRVLVYEDEDPLNIVQLRTRAAVETYALPLDSVNANVGLLTRECLRKHKRDMKFAVGGRSAKANIPTLEALLEIVQDLRIDVLAFAPMSRLHDADDSDSAAMKEIMEVFCEFAYRSNTALLLAHHTPKGAKAATWEAVKGSVDIVNSSRLAMTMFPADDDDVRKYALPPSQKHLFLRLDTVKGNYALGGGAPIWLKRHSVIPLDYRGAGGIGALIPVDLESERRLQAIEICADIRDSFMTDAIGAMSLEDTAKKLIRTAKYAQRFDSHNQLRARIEAVLSEVNYLPDGRRVRMDSPEDIKYKGRYLITLE